ncbi:MAG: hypothetical protein AB8B48_11035, partial [Pseudomonadales bacterium]
PLTFYAATLESYGLHVELVRDISEETFSTFAHWRNNAKKNRTQVIEEIGELGWEKFFKSCEVLEHFWNEDILGYGIVSASK